MSPATNPAGLARPGREPWPPWVLRNRGTAAVAMVMVLIVVNLIVVGITLGVARDHDLTVRRLETMKAAYAAESGVNMSVRELMEDEDEDADGTIGEISSKSLGTATFSVTTVYDSVTGLTTITSVGVCGTATRQMVSELYDE